MKDIEVGQKFLSGDRTVEIVYVNAKIHNQPILDDHGNCYTVDGLFYSENKGPYDLRPIPVVITEGVEFSGPEYREEFERLLKIEGRKFEVRGVDNVLVPLGFTEYVPHCKYVLLPAPQHADANGNALKVGDREEVLV